MQSKESHLMLANAKELAALSGEVRRHEHGTQLQRELRRVLDQLQDARKRQRNCGSAETHAHWQKTIDRLMDEEAHLHNAVAMNRGAK